MCFLFSAPPSNRETRSEIIRHFSPGPTPARAEHEPLAANILGTRDLTPSNTPHPRIGAMFSC